MIRFDCDYAEGCHPRILEALARTNDEQHPGYGTDEHCARARALIREACDAPDADVHFLVGGTQTNAAVIVAILRPWEGVLSAESGHIAAHETGAVEAGGHKVLTLPHTDGKLDADSVRAAVKRSDNLIGIHDLDLGIGMNITGGNNTFTGILDICGFGLI